LGIIFEVVKYKNFSSIYCLHLRVPIKETEVQQIMISKIFKTLL